MYNIMSIVATSGFDCEKLLWSKTLQIADWKRLHVGSGSIRSGSDVATPGEKVTNQGESFFDPL